MLAAMVFSLRLYLISKPLLLIEKVFSLKQINGIVDGNGFFI